MKLKEIILIIAGSLMIGSVIYGQDRDMGDDPERCRINLSTYTEFFNQGNFKDAITAWRWCFNNCPGSTRNIYINGVDIIEYYIENAPDDKTKETYIDTLMMVYDQRIKYYDQKSMVLGRKAIALLKHRPAELVEAYEIMKKSFDVGGNQTEFHVLGYYKNIAVVLFENDVLNAEEIVTLYSEITDVLNFQIENSDDKNRTSRVEAVKERVEELFVNSNAADCDAIISLFGPQLKNNPEDIELAKKIIDLLDRGEGDECKGDLYMKAAIIVYNDEKTAGAALSIAQSYFRKNESEKAEEFYLEAIELEEDDLRKADIYYELALLYFGQLNQYPRARSTVRNTISINPNHGRAYMLIGRIYAAGGRDCGETSFERKAIWWVVVDQFVRARNIDPSVMDDANEFITRYSANFPTQEEGFWEDVHEGDTFTVGCWINEKTTVRYLK